LGASGLIFNVFFSNLLMKTSVGLWDWVATSLIICGGIIVTIFGSIDAEIEDFEALIKIIQTPLFSVYFSIITLALLAGSFLGLFLERRSCRLTEPDSGDGNFETSDSSLKVDSTAYIGLAYASAGGIASSLTLMLVKCGMNLLVNSIGVDGGDSDSHVVLSATLVLCLAFSVVLQLIALNKAIVFISPLIAIPVFYTVFTILSVSNTLVFVFSLPDTTPLPVDIVFTIEMAVVGVSVIVVGVWVLSYASLAGKKK